MPRLAACPDTTSATRCESSNTSKTGRLGDVEFESRIEVPDVSGDATESERASEATLLAVENSRDPPADGED